MDAQNNEGDLAKRPFRISFGIFLRKSPRTCGTLFVANDAYTLTMIEHLCISATARDGVGSLGQSEKVVLGYPLLALT